MRVEATGQEGHASLEQFAAAKLFDFAGNLCLVHGFVQLRGGLIDQWMHHSLP